MCTGVMTRQDQCLGGMRGYEVVWTNLGGLIHDIQCSESKEDLPQYVGQLLDASR